MALSAVSRGAYTLGLGIGKAALPFAIEVISLIAIKSLTNASPKSRVIIATLPGCATLYLTSNFPRFEASDVIAWSIYSLFVVWSVMPDTEKQPVPKGDLWVQFQIFMCELNFFAVNSIDVNSPAGKRAVFAYAQKLHDQVRLRWKDPEIIKQADALLRKAASQMDALYDDLVRAVADVPMESRNEKMAELLTRWDGPNDYYDRYCKEGSITLLDIYRALRGLRFSVICTNPSGQRCSFSVIDNYNKLGRQQLSEDTDPFFTPGTPQYEWRWIYNKTVERFAPILKEMILRAETLPFKAWATPDYNDRVAYEKAGAFRLYPCDKPK